MGVWENGGVTKTTLDIADEILARAKRLAEEEQLTLRSLVEEGLSRVLEGRGKRKAKKIRPVVYGGQGLQPEFREGDWKAIRDAVYDGHGA